MSRAENIGREWIENSSLEKWFPITAEHVTALENRVKELEAGLRIALSLINECERPTCPDFYRQLKQATSLLKGGKV
jgi:hypothetical protein